MFTNTLSPDTLRSIEYLGKEKIVDFAYLAGGTALALQLGHRISVDLDFFSLNQFDENEVSQNLRKTGEYTLDRNAWQTVMGKLMDTKFSLFYYDYPLIEKTHDFQGINIASLQDIAAMKLHAIEDRGARRDFIDLYFLCQQFPITQMLNWYDQKYKVLESHQYHILRGLTYFEDALMQEMPVMLKSVDWSKLENYFINEVKKLSKEKLPI